MTTILHRLTSDGPKRILALDGGGIRGIITLGYLQRLEEILKKRYGNNPDFRLSHYFDLIGGTSTGSIIGTCLSLGMSVKEVTDLYLNLGPHIFGQKQSIFRRFTGAKFSNRALQAALKNCFGDLTLNSEAIKTGLCIVLKRVDTGNTWPLLNHPKGIYFDSNKGILLRQAVRASTAAPTYFTPEKLEVGRGEEAVFVDGGVSMHNSPALLLFLIATIKGFAFDWPVGSKNLLIVSIGTGSGFTRNSSTQVMNNRIWDWGKQIPDLLIRDAAIQGHLLLQYMSNSPTRTGIDMQIGDMKEDLLGGKELISYLRYSVNLESNELNTLGITEANIKSLMDMSNAKNIDILKQIGRSAADQNMLDTHFSTKFDISLI
jgi:patatin-like phospholipase/acyl hydrolase